MRKYLRIRPLLSLSMLLLCLMGLTMSAEAQRKPARKPAPKPAAKPTPTPVAPLAVKQQAEKVGIQIKNLTRFIYLLGGAAQSIEAIDRDPRASADAKRKSNEGKQTLLQTIRNVRAGVVQLEGDFHSKPELRKFIPFIQGSAEMTGVAEDQAVGGQFNNAGKTLLEVVNKLTDTLQNLR